MTNYEAVKEIARREVIYGVCPHTVIDLSFGELYDKVKENNSLDEDYYLYPDDLEERIIWVSKSHSERDRFMRALFPEEELVQWG
jgi:hypothetical protein